MGMLNFCHFLSSSTVEDVRTNGPTNSLGEQYLRLFTAKNPVLVDPDRTLEEAADKGRRVPCSRGTSPSFIAASSRVQPQVAAATHSAFALWCHGDNAIVTWGDAKAGGDSSAVQDQLRGVQQIQATRCRGICCGSGRWIRHVTWGFAGRQWWRQFGSSRSAQGCAADSSHCWRGLCCDSGRWIRCQLGFC